MFLKIDKWWIYKIGGGFFTYILFKYLAYESVDFSNLQLNDVYLLIILVLLAVYGHLINDFSDFNFDIKSNKHNLFENFPVFTHQPIIILIGTIVLLTAHFLLNNNVFLIIVFQFICSILYSIKPFRLKEKGVFALLLTGIYERSLPYLIIIVHVVNKQALQQDILLITVTYLAWSYLWECRNYLNGQLNDFVVDKQLSVKTIVVEYGVAKVQNVKTTLLYLEIFVLLIWLAMLVYLYTSFIGFVIMSVLFLSLLKVANPVNNIFSSVESFFDYYYNYIFLTSLTLLLIFFKKIYWPLALFVLVLFQNKYTKYTLLYFYSKIKLMLSRAVNYSIYYFRRLIMGWSDSDSRRKISLFNKKHNNH